MPGRLIASGVVDGELAGLAPDQRSPSAPSGFRLDARVRQLEGENAELRRRADRAALAQSEVALRVQAEPELALATFDVAGLLATAGTDGVLRVDNCVARLRRIG